MTTLRGSVTLAFAAGLAAASCSGSAAAPAPGVAESPAPVEASATPDETKTDPLAEPNPEPSSAAGASESSVPPAEDPDAQREIRYVQTPEGLRVEILGVKFLPRAEPVKTPAGIGVRVTLSATTSEARSLLAPEHGPLAFAGVVKRKGKSEPEAFGDERKGDGELALDPSKPASIARDWPGKKATALGNGDVLELDVGLWGLGTSAHDRRPVKQFLRVELKVEGWKGRTKIKPPPSVAGK